VADDLDPAAVEDLERVADEPLGATTLGAAEGCA
jgi:hypothetical protein